MAGRAPRHGQRLLPLTCSALKRAYRDVLRRGAPETFFVCLLGDESLLRERMENRDHFMPASLLTSQIDTLEPLGADESGVSIDVGLDVDAITKRVAWALRTA